MGKYRNELVLLAYSIHDYDAARIPVRLPPSGTWETSVNVRACARNAARNAAVWSLWLQEDANARTPRQTLTYVRTERSLIHICHSIPCACYIWMSRHNRNSKHGQHARFICSCLTAIFLLVLCILSLYILCHIKVELFNFKIVSGNIRKFI